MIPILECNTKLFWFLHFFPEFYFYLLVVLCFFQGRKKLYISKIFFSYLFYLLFFPSLLGFFLFFLFTFCLVLCFHSMFSASSVFFLALIYSFISWLALSYSYNSVMNFAYHISSSLFILVFWDLVFLLWMSNVRIGEEFAGEVWESRVRKGQDIFPVFLIL